MKYHFSQSLKRIRFSINRGQEKLMNDKNYFKKIIIFELFSLIGCFN